ncbi:hypothetical protein [Marinilabilia rubra]|uniref:Uncharacterized protein n=1 Tax=Marinilabilia rubra TaxID=2162893 RepID=A0A2U2B7I3_9BACT|nr:hypothetical protein [Marinilabilia rubra]PWD99030.1 hypothetical protein DDZ16_12250 [Marinilabilia rubra]
MNSKKKVIFGMIAGFFAVATVFNMGIETHQKSSDTFLDVFSHIATAGSESNYDEGCSGFGCSGEGSGCTFQSDEGYPVGVGGCKN